MCTQRVTATIDYPDTWFDFSTSPSSLNLSFTLLGCSIGTTPNAASNSGDDDDTTYSNSACVENDSDEDAYWLQMANCRRAQLVFQLWSDKSCKGTPTTYMSTLGVSSFLTKLSKLGESTVLDNAIETLSYYEECTYTDEGYVMLGCSPSEVGHYVVGIYDDKSCFNMVGVKSDLSEINNYMQSRSQYSKNYGYKNCANLDQSYTVYESAYYNGGGSGSNDDENTYTYQTAEVDVFTYLNANFASFGPVGAYQTCNGFDAPQCAESSSLGNRIEKFAATAVDTAKLGVAYVMFVSSAFVLLVSFNVMYKRRKLKTAKRRSLEKKLKEERRRARLQTQVL